MNRRAIFKAFGALPFATLVKGKETYKVVNPDYEKAPFVLVRAFNDDGSTRFFEFAPRTKCLQTTLQKVRQFTNIEIVIRDGKEVRGNRDKKALKHTDTVEVPYYLEA